jgi:NarL family two-component system sensor histidine kinase LiaS
METIRKSLRQLRWQLTLSYSVVTVGTLLVAVLILGPILLSQIFLPTNVLSPLDWYEIAREDGPLIQELLEQEPIDYNLIRVLMGEMNNTITSRPILQVGALEIGVRTIGQVNIILLGPDGELLSAQNMSNLPGARFGVPLNPDLIPGLSEPLKNAMNLETNPTKLISVIAPDEEFILVFPVTSFDAGTRQYLGTVIVHIQRLPTSSDIPIHALQIAGRGLLLFLIGAGLLGTLFGALTANRLAQRFERISSTAEAWSQGDLTQNIGDNTGDEISQLAENLDGMATQLLESIEERQELAVMEERNRLARELHDSTKQQALAASFQLAAAMNLYDSDPQAAKSHLQEAESLVDSVRVELTDLIHELRPASLEGRDLSEALETYAIEWAHQNDIKIEITVAEDQNLALKARQTLYRVAQEALANVTRHSGARRVELSLSYETAHVIMCLEDDGCGFDTSLDYPGMGLESMRERCLGLGGSLDIDSRPASGTMICAALPLEKGLNNDG